MIEGMIAAVGFRGGDAIIRGNGEVQELTTAANIWVCGAVGLACGAGHYVIAVITCGFTAAIVSGMYVIERWLRWREARPKSAAAAVAQREPGSDC